jgi:hypothetical protein
VTERPQNVRVSRGGGYNSRRSIPEARSADDNQIGNWAAYRGSHRAAGQHHLDHQTPAQQRNSRVGRHHAEPPPHDDLASR